MTNKHFLLNIGSTLFIGYICARYLRCLNSMLLDTTDVLSIRLCHVFVLIDSGRGLIGVNLFERNNHRKVSALERRGKESFYRPLGENEK